MPKNRTIAMPKGNKRRLNTDTPADAAGGAAVAPPSNQPTPAALAVTQSDAYTNLVHAVATTYRTGSAQQVETLYNIGKMVADLSAEGAEKKYGNRRVENLSADLKKVGVKLGRSMLYAAQRFATIFTPEQMIDGVKVGMTVRNVVFLVADRFSDSVRNKTLRSLIGGEIKPDEVEKHVEESGAIKPKQSNRGLPKSPIKLAARMASTTERFITSFTEPAKIFVAAYKGLNAEEKADKVFVKQAKDTLKQLNSARKTIEDQIAALEKIVE